MLNFTGKTVPKVLSTARGGAKNLFSMTEVKPFFCSKIGTV